jgi:hypothetical protein
MDKRFFSLLRRMKKKPSTGISEGFFDTQLPVWMEGLKILCLCQAGNEMDRYALASKTRAASLAV